MSLQKLQGFERLQTIVTSEGTEYCVSRSGRVAWPLWGEPTPYQPYDTEVAEIRGWEVDSRIDPDDYRVRGAGLDWAEVYDQLRSRVVSA